MGSKRAKSKPSNANKRAIDTEGNSLVKRQAEKVIYNNDIENNQLLITKEENIKDKTSMPTIKTKKLSFYKKVKIRWIVSIGITIVGIVIVFFFTLNDRSTFIYGKDAEAPKLKVSPNRMVVFPNEKIIIKAYDIDGIFHIGYCWDSDKTKAVSSDRVETRAPSTIGEHYLKFYAYDNSHTYNLADWTILNLRVKKPIDVIKYIIVEQSFNIFNDIKSFMSFGIIANIALGLLVNFIWKVIENRYKMNFKN